MKNYVLVNANVTMNSIRPHLEAQMGKTLSKSTKVTNAMILAQLQSMQNDISIIKQDIVDLKKDVSDIKIRLTNLETEARKHGWNI